MNIRLKQLMTVAALVAATALAAQQPFQLDPSFGTAFQGQAIGDILELSDGSIIVSGDMYYDYPMDGYAGGILDHNGNWIPKPVELSWVDWYGYMGGKIIPYGNNRFYVGNGQGIRRYWLDGTWDSDFKVTNQPLYSVMQGGDFHIFPDGRVLMTGSHQLRDTVRGFVGHDYGLVWLNTDGSLDTTRIHRKVAPWGAIRRIHELPDGKFICSDGGGLFEGDSISNLTFRVHPDGSLDTTFQAPSIDFTSIWNFLPVENGKVLLFGRFHVIGMPDTLSLVRLLPNGQLDPTFHNHAVYGATYHHLATPSVRGVRRINDGLLAVTGDFDQIDGETRGGIAMLDTAGNLLPGYFEGSGCGGFYWPPVNPAPYPRQFIVGIKEAMDGSYYIYGSYRGFDDGITNDTTQHLISRLYGLNVGIQEHAAPRPLSIAPNPANGVVQLSVASRASATSGASATAGAILTIHDASGRVVRQEPWPAGAYTHTLQAGTLAPGVYVLRVASRASATAATASASAAAGATPLYTGRLVVVP